MHLIYEGVKRRLIIFWLRGPVEYKCRLSGRSVQLVSDRLQKLRGYMCSEFARKPRSLTEIDRWKATEFRVFLLYLGPFVLLDILNLDHYNHFLLLHVALYCLCSARPNKTHTDYAATLLVQFVKDACNLYGAEFTVCNVHSLLHICDDAKNMAILTVLFHIKIT